VVWEGRSREAPPYPDHWRKADVCSIDIDDAPRREKPNI
jgi:hypothetical protein